MAPSRLAMAIEVVLRSRKDLRRRAAASRTVYVASRNISRGSTSPPMPASPATLPALPAPELALQTSPAAPVPLPASPTASAPLSSPTASLPPLPASPTVPAPLSSPPASPAPLSCPPGFPAPLPAAPTAPAPLPSAPASPALHVVVAVAASSPGAHCVAPGDAISESTDEISESTEEFSEPSLPDSDDPLKYCSCSECDDLRHEARQVAFAKRKAKYKDEGPSTPGHSKGKGPIIDISDDDEM